jgi:DNA-directed RNA polymerase subunit RPC12/RpoP
MSDFVTIATYDDYLTANFDRQKLDEHEIDCYLADENTIAIQWTLMNALGGIKLRVSQEQAEEALRIINEKEEGIQADFKLEEKKDDLKCPICSSNNTGTEKYSKSIAGWTWLLLGFPVTATLIKQHRCFYCGHKWET